MKRKFEVWMIKKNGSGEMFLNSYKTKKECNNIIDYLVSECDGGRMVNFEIR